MQVTSSLDLNAGRMKGEGPEGWEVGEAPHHRATRRERLRQPKQPIYLMDGMSYRSIMERSLPYRQIPSERERERERDRADNHIGGTDGR
jgi:hypothetical protein